MNRSPEKQRMHVDDPNGVGDLENLSAGSNCLFVAEEVGLTGVGYWRTSSRFQAVLL